MKAIDEEPRHFGPHAKCACRSFAHRDRYKIKSALASRLKLSTQQRRLLCDYDHSTTVITKEYKVGARVVGVAEWYRYRIVACLVTSSSPVPLKTRRVGQRFTLNLSRAETSSRWCGVVVRRGGASSGVVHVT
ncbi:uncharacterized protein TNCV_530651 [Trichonephila clavipes]|nr:uncharacterized protein TNCV_530651 [Trichonephila clavipes]